MSKATRNSARFDSNGWARSKITELTGKMPRIVDVLGCSGEFYLTDVDDGPDIDCRRYARVVELLVAKGAIETVEQERVKGKTRHIYRWHRPAKADLRAHLYERDDLPCGCRAHIPDGRDDPEGVLSCSYCGTQHSKATIREAIE